MTAKKTTKPTSSNSGKPASAASSTGKPSRSPSAAAVLSGAVLPPLPSASNSGVLEKSPLLQPLPRPASAITVAQQPLGGSGIAEVSTKHDAAAASSEVVPKLEEEAGGMSLTAPSIKEAGGAASPGSDHPEMSKQAESATEEQTTAKDVSMTAAATITASPENEAQLSESAPKLGSTLPAQDESGDVKPPSPSPPPPPSPPKRVRGMRAAAAGANGKPLLEAEPEEDEEEVQAGVEEEEDDGETRCVCAEDNDELSSGLMIECEMCNCWQHGPCVGLWDEKDCPDTYYCEQCKPSWHGPGGILRKAHRKNPVPAPPAQNGRSPSVTASRTSASKAQGGESGSRSPSPPPNAKDGKSATGKKLTSEPPAKKRSTMNSRDAAYDDAIALSILESGSGAARAKLEKKSKSAGGGGGRKSASQSVEPGEGEDDDDSANKRSEPASKRRKLSLDRAEDTMDVDREGVEARAADGEHGTSPPPTTAPANVPPRAKHPNQYTYRPKNAGGPAVTSARTGRASPVKRSTKDTNGGGKDRDPTYGPSGSGTGGAGGGGGSANATDSSRSQRPRDWNGSSENSGFTSGAGWGMPDHLRHLHHLLPSPQPQPLIVPASASNAATVPGWDPAQSQTLQQYEPPTRVRFPNKRMTMPEMKKRSRSVLEYLAKVQVEMGEREKRVEMLGLGTNAGGKGTDYSGTVEEMEALTKALHSFQQTYFGGD